MLIKNLSCLLHISIFIFVVIRKENHSISVSTSSVICQCWLRQLDFFLKNTRSTCSSGYVECSFVNLTFFAQSRKKRTILELCCSKCFSEHIEFSFDHTIQKFFLPFLIYVTFRTQVNSRFNLATSHLNSKVKVQAPLPALFLERLLRFYQLLQGNVHFSPRSFIFDCSKISFEFFRVLWLQLQNSKNSKNSGKAWNFFYWTKIHTFDFTFKYISIHSRQYISAVAPWLGSPYVLGSNPSAIVLFKCIPDSCIQSSHFCKANKQDFFR